MLKTNFQTSGCTIPRVEDFLSDEIPGSPGFMAPEQFDGYAGDALTDQFALGVTLYRWFTGTMPYGETEAFQRARFVTPLPLARHRPDIPSWLDAAIRTAIAPRREDRFGDVIELLRVLEAGGPLHGKVLNKLPLAARHPLRFWQILSAILALALIGSLLIR